MLSKVLSALFVALAIVLCAAQADVPSEHAPTPIAAPVVPAVSPADAPVPSVVAPEPVNASVPSPHSANPPKPLVDEHIQKWIDIGVLAAAMVVGLVWCFAGYRILKPVLFLAGFILASYITYNVLIGHTTLHGDRAWISMGIAAGAGLLCGIILVLVFKIGVFIIGFIFGAVIATLVVAFTPLNGIILKSVASSLGLWVFLACIVGLGALVGFAAVIFTRPIAIFVTSFNGAYLIMHSVDVFTDWNLLRVLSKVLTGVTYTQIPLTWTAYHLYVIFGGILVLGIAGIVVQAKFTSRGYHHDPAVMDRKPQGQDEIPLLEP